MRQGALCGWGAPQRACGQREYLASRQSSLREDAQREDTQGDLLLSLEEACTHMAILQEGLGAWVGGQEQLHDPVVRIDSSFLSRLDASSRIAAGCSINPYPPPTYLPT